MPTGRFNPRAREGRDVLAMQYHVRRSCFNPRAREGRDWLMAEPRKILIGFQSTRP